MSRCAMWRRLAVTLVLAVLVLAANAQMEKCNACSTSGLLLNLRRCKMDQANGVGEFIVCTTAAGMV